jgi:hypothetical protein
MDKLDLESTMNCLKMTCFGSISKITAVVNNPSINNRSMVLQLHNGQIGPGINNELTKLVGK